jgi:hypothetical protein
MYRVYFNQLLKTGAWVDSKIQLILCFILFILCGYIWWIAYMFYLLQHSDDLAIFGFIAGGMVAAFAFNQFSAFIRVIALTFFIVLIGTILWVVFFPPSDDHHLYYWIILFAFQAILLVQKPNKKRQTLRVCPDDWVIFCNYIAIQYALIGTQAQNKFRSP